MPAVLGIFDTFCKTTFATVSREEQTSKICCLRSTSTGIGRVVRLSGWGWSILCREEDADRWSWFIRKKFGIKSEKPTLGRRPIHVCFRGEKRTSHFNRVKSVDDPERTLTRTTHCDPAGTNIGRGPQQFRFVQDFRTLVGPWSLNVGANDGVLVGR